MAWINIWDYFSTSVERTWFWEGGQKTGRFWKRQSTNFILSGITVFQWVQDRTSWKRKLLGSRRTEVELLKFSLKFLIWSATYPLYDLGNIRNITESQFLNLWSVNNQSCGVRIKWEHTTSGICKHLGITEKKRKKAKLYITKSKAYGAT